MSAATDLTAASWRVFSDLLDQGLALPPTERPAWVDGLDAEHESLKPALRRVLQPGVETRQWLHTLPHTESNGALADTQLHPGAAVGQYRLLRELGVGGMGAVWLAERADGSLKRQVALKLPHATWGAGLAQRMARERDILASLEHPHIARLYDAGTDANGRPFLALEYVEGEPIDVYCRQHALAIKPRLALLLQVAQAVAFAHSRLVVHRDLKPSNILVTADGQVRLLDFGIAKLMEGDRTAETQLTQLAGRALTLDYASPEQIRGEPIGTASDVYSLAVVSFELLTGAKPYKLKRGSMSELEEAIAAIDAPLASATATDPGVKRELKGDLDAILNKALKKAPEQRYPTVSALAEDIQRWLREDPVLAQADSTWYRARKFISRNRLAVGAACVVAVAIVAGSVVALWQAQVASTQAQLAQQQSEAARREAKRAQAVQAFLLDIFRSNSHLQSDPIKARVTTAREMLDIGAARIGETLKDVPEAQLEVLSVLVDMYTQLALNEDAAALRRQGLEVARRTFGPADTRLADALLSYSATLHQSRRRAEIPALHQEARAILDRAGDQSSYLRGALMYETARYARYESLARARESADAAVAYLREFHPQRPRLINVARLATRARLYALDYTGAETIARQAVDLARDQKAAASAWLVGTLADLGETQWLQLKIDDAERSYRESVATSLSANGVDHPETLTSSIKLASLLLQSGRREEGEALANDVMARMTRPDAKIAAGRAADIRGILAAARFEFGLPADADEPTLADVIDLRATYPNSGALAMRLRTLAEIQNTMGRYEEALRSVAEGAEVWQRYAGPTPPPAISNPFALTRARLALTRGDFGEALSELERVSASPVSGDGTDPYLLQADIERSRAALGAGQPTLAMTAAQRVLNRLQTLPSGRLPVIEARALVALGRAQAALGETHAARTSLDRAVKLHQANGPALGLWRAEAEAALGNLIATSNPTEAGRLLASARRIRAAHPTVGPPSRNVSASVH